MSKLSRDLMKPVKNAKPLPAKINTFRQAVEEILGDNINFTSLNCKLPNCPINDRPEAHCLDCLVNRICEAHKADILLLADGMEQILVKELPTDASFRNLKMMWYAQGIVAQLHECQVYLRKETK